MKMTPPHCQWMNVPPLPWGMPNCWVKLRKELRLDLMMWRNESSIFWSECGVRGSTGPLLLVLLFSAKSSYMHHAKFETNRKKKSFMHTKVEFDFVWSAGCTCRFRHTTEHLEFMRASVQPTAGLFAWMRIYIFHASHVLGVHTCSRRNLHFTFRSKQRKLTFSKKSSFMCKYINQ